MSPRNFTRVFTRETGRPARYVTEARLAAARQRLEQTTEPWIALPKKWFWQQHQSAPGV
jgi:transcriptional regulator GlxA family with amidase domain